MRRTGPHMHLTLRYATVHYISNPTFPMFSLKIYFFGAEKGKSFQPVTYLIVRVGPLSTMWRTRGPSWDQERTLDTGVLWGFIVPMDMRGLVPPLPRAMMVNGTIRLQFAKVRLSLKHLSSSGLAQKKRTINWLFGLTGICPAQNSIQREITWEKESISGRKWKYIFL